MVSGQVDMAGAWYVHAIDFTAKGKHVIDIANLSGAPGEREMCTKASGVTSPANFKGKDLGVTDLGSGTDNLTTLPGRRITCPPRTSTTWRSAPAARLSRGCRTTASPAR